MTISIMVHLGADAGLKPSGVKRARKVAEAALSKVGSGYVSATGQTLALGVEYCEKRHLNYRITCQSGGYYIERLPD